MKARLFLIAALAMILVACNMNRPDSPSQKHTGKIIGTFGCVEEGDRSVFHKGYFIETDDKQVVLSFNIDVHDSIRVPLGVYGFADIPIPYSFSVTILVPSDKEYIHYAMVPDDTMHQSISTPLDEIEQALITPLK